MLVPDSFSTTNNEGVVGVEIAAAAFSISMG
jgi:hypothetical protein